MSIIAEYSLGNFFFCWLLPVTWCMQASVSISSIIYSPVTISWIYTLNFKGFVAKTAFNSFFKYFCNLWNLFLAENLSVRVYSSLCGYQITKCFKKQFDRVSEWLSVYIRSTWGNGGGSTELNEKNTINCFCLMKIQCVLGSRIFWHTLSVWKLRASG